jgi:hypothetical protein
MRAWQQAVPALLLASTLGVAVAVVHVPCGGSLLFLYKDLDDANKEAKGLITSLYASRSVFCCRPRLVRAAAAHCAHPHSYWRVRSDAVCAKLAHAAAQP